MSKELIFYTNPSSRGRIVRWMLEEIGAEYQTKIIEYGTMIKSEDYLSINPMGKVPALTHKGQTITETAAILAYLADAFPQANLAPNNAIRGEYYRWLFFGAGCIEPALFHNKFGNKPTTEQSGMLGYGSYELVLNTLESLLQDKKYLVNNTFSAADVYIASEINYGLQFKTIENRPIFEKYISDIITREAFIRAEKIDNDLIAAATN